MSRGLPMKKGNAHFTNIIWLKTWKISSFFKLEIVHFLTVFSIFRQQKYASHFSSETTIKNYQFAQWMIQFHSINKRTLEFTSKSPFNNLKQTQFNKFKTNTNKQTTCKANFKDIAKPSLYIYFACLVVFNQTRLN